MSERFLSIYQLVILVFFNRGVATKLFSSHTVSLFPVFKHKFIDEILGKSLIKIDSG